MIWPDEIEAKYNEELENVVWPLVTTERPVLKVRLTEEIENAVRDLNNAKFNPVGKKTEWLKRVDECQQILNDLVAQDNQIINDNDKLESDYITAFHSEINALKEVILNQWSAVRNTRNYLLSQCDWTQLADSPLTSDKKEEWRIYRQNLRDIPDICSSINSIIWPDKPE